MSDKAKDDERLMEDGVAKLLGKKKYDTVEAPPPCEHEDDGFVYGATNTYITVRCKKCGTYYDIPRSTQ